LIYLNDYVTKGRFFDPRGVTGKVTGRAEAPGNGVTNHRRHEGEAYDI